MISCVELKRRIRYVPETGVFIWMPGFGLGKSQRENRRAGTLGEDGYRRIKLIGRSYYEQDLAVLYMTGAWSKDQVDHRQVGKEFRSDNRWSELRPATKSQNRGNIGKYKNNTSSYKGVSWKRASQRWVAAIRVNGRLKYLGIF